MMTGEAEAKKSIIFPSCAGYLRKWNLTTKNCCCTWLKKSQEASPRTAYQPYCSKVSRNPLSNCQSPDPTVWQICGKAAQTTPFAGSPATSPELLCWVAQLW